MIFLLRLPAVLVSDALALLVGIVLHGVVQARVAAALGDRQALAAGRGHPDPRRHFEPFGVIAMIIAGIGWGKQVPLTEPRFRGARSRYVLAVVSGPAANLLLALVCVALARVVGTVDRDSGVRLFSGAFGAVLLTEFALVNAAIGVLTLIPLPPLDGSRLLWLWAPRTAGWQKARYYLEEQNFGLALCVVLILPLFGGMGLLARIVFSVTYPLLDALYSLVGL